MATKKVTLDPGESREVAFTLIPDIAKVYAVSIDGLSGSFNVLEPPLGDLDHRGNRAWNTALYKNWAIGQQFTLPGDCLFNRCFIYHGPWSWLPGVPHEIALRLQICLDSGDKPFTVLATSDISCAGLVEKQYADFTYSFDTIQIANGQKAWVVIMFEPAPGPWWPSTGWRADDAGAVPAGIVRRSFDGGATWTEAPLADFPPKCCDFRLYAVLKWNGHEDRYPSSRYRTFEVPA